VSALFFVVVTDECRGHAMHTWTSVESWQPGLALCAMCNMMIMTMSEIALTVDVMALHDMAGMQVPANLCLWFTCCQGSCI
jgi:hypothetical protein